MTRFLHSVDRLIFLDGDDVRRAPIAAALFERFAKRHPVLSSWNIEVRSAGSGKLTVEGATPHPKAIEVMQSMGIYILRHKAATITAEDIEGASIILAIEPKHKKYVDENVCAYAGHRVKVIPFFQYLGALDDFVFDSLVGSQNVSAYLSFANQVEGLFPRIAYRFKQDALIPLLARGQGFGVAVVEGKARKLDEVLQSGGMEKGDVLVCSDAQIDSRLIDLAGAIVTDRTSDTGRLSDIAYESGIPVVGGTLHGTEAIEDGVAVIVDGLRGQVFGRQVP